MNNLRFTVVSNKRVSWSDHLHTVRFTAAPDGENPTGALSLIMPVEEAKRWIVGYQYFLQLWPVPVAEQRNPAPAGSPASQE